MEEYIDNFRGLLGPYQLGRILLDIERNRYRKEISIEIIEEFWNYVRRRVIYSNFRERRRRRSMKDPNNLSLINRLCGSNDFHFGIMLIYYGFMRYRAGEVGDGL
jgi:hypothetical protein